MRNRDLHFKTILLVESETDADEPEMVRGSLTDNLTEGLSVVLAHSKDSFGECLPCSCGGRKVLIHQHACFLGESGCLLLRVCRNPRGEREGHVTGTLS